MTKSQIKLSGKPDERILLIAVARKNNCEIVRESDGTLWYEGTIHDVMTTRLEFYGLWVAATLSQALTVARFPKLSPKTVETDFMNGFVCQACFYLTGEAKKTLKSTEQTLIGGNFADVYFQESMVINAR